MAGRTAVLTGVAGGWGRAVLDRFLDKGWDVCATTRSAGTDVPSQVLVVEADLTDTAAAEHVIAATLERFGSVDALACVAGGFRADGPLHESSPDVWRAMLSANLDTAYTMTRAALTPMLAAGSGSIVYVGSRAAVRPFPGAAPYIVAKGAVLALMGAVDAEVRSKGLRVNTVMASLVDTPQNRRENPDADTSRWTTGEQLARVIEWLCDEDSAPLSGGAIPAYGRARSDNAVTSLLIDNLAQYASPVAAAPARGSALGEVEVVTGAAIAIVDGRIAACGPRDQVLGDHGDLPVYDAGGRAAIPGLVDCHTHAAFGGDRAGEFDLRSQGAGYEQIHAAGGGIAASVRDTRAAAADGTLGALLDRHLAWMAAAGTTTAEVKSGYGLDHDTELAMLAAAAADHPIEVAPTFLGAHAVGPEWDDADDYLTFVIKEVLPQAAVHAEAADVFLERGAFDRDQAERYLRAAAAHGLVMRLHADQFSEAGGVSLAVELGARSVDHLEATGPDGVAALAASDVAAVLLPACVVMLDLPRPPVRELADAGAIVALATDFNPGSAFCNSLPLVMSLACMQLGMSPAEALVACTVNAAWVLRRGDRLGRIAPGYDGDVVLLDSDDWRHAAYHLGGPAVAGVIKAGRRL